MKILIVDDVPGWLRFHQINLEYLNIENLKIDTATSANEALSKIELSVDSPYDAIFTDLQMESDFLPKLAGEWLVEQIQLLKQYFNAKIYICSAAYNIKMIAENYNVNYIPKSLASRDREVYKGLI